MNLIKRLANKSPFVYNKLVRLSDLIHGIFFTRIHRIKKLVAKKPLFLAIETVSACNARCIFCAYPTMKREKAIMPMPLFRKVVDEYSRSGGGALSLTPVMGEPFLDPHIIERYKTLEQFKNIDQISLTTNGIALEKLSDDELKYILMRTFLIQFSLGGLDEETYKKLYRVDQLKNVLSSVNRVIALKREIKNKVHIILAFRTNNPNFEQDCGEELDKFRRQGVIISHISTFFNYGGVIGTNDIVLKNSRVTSKKSICALPLIYPHVLSNGKVTNCGCADAEGNGLIIGDSSEETIADLWGGERRSNILNSFLKGTPPKLCQGCTAYRPSTFLGANIFKNVGQDRKLPLEFYIKFLGG